MSTTGQTHSDRRGLPLPGPGRPVVGLARDYADEIVDWHAHDCGQVLYASSGLRRVETHGGLWVLPPQRAVWVPPGTQHRVVGVGPIALRTLYVAADLPGLPQRCRAIAVSPLLRELILEMTRCPPDYPPDGPEVRLAAVILDLLRAPPLPALHLPIPADRRLRPLVQALLAEPADGRGLADWARRVGASERTIARLFLRDTGMGFREWRQQLRLHEGLARLARGEPVTQVAYAVGYDSPSAFIAMFRRALGESPARYLGRGARAGLPEPQAARKERA